MTDYYTYAYLREDGTPYYIGKGRGNRIDSYNRTWKPPSKEKRLFLKQNLSEEDALKHEIYLISVLGRKDLETGILRNMTDGGDGGAPMKGRNHSEETKEKMRQTKLGKKHTIQDRKNMSESHKGLKYPNRKSSPHSEETKEKMRQSRLEYLKRKQEVANGHRG
tara:strand:- start:17 stop:508 length:492 start_codon:yes stop_codon:yes gene_type:complete